MSWVHPHPRRSPIASVAASCAASPGAGVSTAGLRALASVSVVALFALAPNAGAAVCFVTTAGVASNNGAAWTSPIDLQSALGSSTCTEIWVKKGVYKPTTGSDQTISFQVHPGVAVYGGFAGNETQRSQRSPALNLTVLSGDIDNNDKVDANGIDQNASDIVGSNSHHVVLMDGTTTSGTITASTVLDGFTITGGQANGTSHPADFGGGLYCNGTNAPNVCSPMLANLAFIGNTAVSGGGALFDDGFNGGDSSPSLTNVIFNGNSSGSNGGAMVNSAFQSGTSSPSLNNVAFSGNISGNANSNSGGGAMFNIAQFGGTSSPTLTNVTFSGNSESNGTGGAISTQDANNGTTNATLSNVTFRGNSASGFGGAIYSDVTTSGHYGAKLVNVTFSGNSASTGGAVFYDGTFGTNAPTLSFVTFSSNVAAGSAGAIGTNQGGATPQFDHVILWGDTATQVPSCNEACNTSGGAPTFTNSIVQGSHGSGAGWNTALGNDGGHNLDADPLLGQLQNNGGLTQTLLPGGSRSAAWNAATDCKDATGVVVTVDQRGLSRPQGSACDIGAVEVSDRIFSDDFDPCCRLGGTVSSLTGSGLVLHVASTSVNADKAIAGNGLYDFAPTLPPGTAFNVSIKIQPGGQTCALANASGTMGSAPQENVNVACAP